MSQSPFTGKVYLIEAIDEILKNLKDIKSQSPFTGKVYLITLNDFKIDDWISRSQSPFTGKVYLIY